jgi:acyl-CoA thioesterase-1
MMWTAALLLIGHVFASTAMAKPLIVSCIGDGITWGLYASDRKYTSYPARLQQDLGDGYHVTNFGRSWSTMLKNGDAPYWNSLEYTAFMSQAHVDVVIIMLGTNDAKDHNWKQHGSEFEADYEAFVNQIRTKFGNDVRILGLIPPPLYATNLLDIDVNPYTVNVLLPGLFRRIQRFGQIELIDVFNFMGGRAFSHPDYFVDGVHPTDLGYSQMAKFVTQAVLNGPPGPTDPLQDRKINVACIGDSITYPGGGNTDITHAYAGVLQLLLGTDFSVTNLGNSGKTMMKHADDPYWRTDTFIHMVNLDPEPDVVTIMLGTNDGKNHNWNDNSAQEYFDDYTEMIKIVKAFKSKPIVHLMVPPPLYIDGVFDMNTTLINSYVHDLVPKIAEANGVDWISVFDLLGGADLLHPEYISDGCHPTNLGHYQIGLKLAEVVMADKLKLIENGPDDITTIAPEQIY